MASLTVMKESAKCLSGRDRLRVGLTRPSSRGGEMPRAFGDDERVAAKNDGDVMVPSGKRASLEVVEPELAFEVFIRTFGSPAFLEKADDLLLAQSPRQGGEDELVRLRFALGPLDDEPNTFSLGGVRTIVGRRHHASKAESRSHFRLGALPPSESAKGSSGQMLGHLGRGVRDRLDDVPHYPATTFACRRRLRRHSRGPALALSCETPTTDHRSYRQEPTLQRFHSQTRVSSCRRPIRSSS